MEKARTKEKRLKKIFDAVLAPFRRKPKRVSAPLRRVDFKSDFECLFSVISTYIENERFKITISQKKILSDSDLLEIAQVITEKTVTTISPEYRKVICAYISSDSLVEFISEIVVRNVVQLGLDINRKTVS